MSVPMGFFQDLLSVGDDVAELEAAGFTIYEAPDSEYDLHENADMTSDDVTAALLDGAAADAHIEEVEWN